jgi:hypothetical protein
MTTISSIYCSIVNNPSALAVPSEPGRNFTGLAVHRSAFVRYPFPRAEPLPPLRLLLQQGQKVQGDDGTLAGRQVAAVQVGGDDPLDGRAAARPFGEAGRYSGDLAGRKAIPAVENLALVENDGLPQTSELDVVGKLTKLGVAQQRKCETGGVELVGSSGWFHGGRALELEGILVPQYAGCQLLLGFQADRRGLKKTYRACMFSGGGDFLRNAVCTRFSLGLEGAGSGVVYFGNVLPGGFSWRVLENPSESLGRSYSQKGNRPVAVWDRLPRSAIAGDRIPNSRFFTPGLFPWGGISPSPPHLAKNGKPAAVPNSATRWHK